MHPVQLILRHLSGQELLAKQVYTFFFDIYWKKAVDLANSLTSGSTLSVPKGYTVDSSGNVSSSKTTAVTSQLNQTAASLFKTNLNAGKVKGTSITYKSTLTGYVFYTIRHIMYIKQNIFNVKAIM